jgi:fatty-acyl-CoA synthase
MALIAATSALDLAKITEGMRALPDYARPVFLRVRRELDITATFKHRKHDLAKEGFDPLGIADPLYVFDRAQGAYVALDADRFAAIECGAMRL